MAGGATAVAGIAVLSRSSIVTAETRGGRDRSLTEMRDTVGDYAN
jgi:hypothetical protein